MSKTQIFRYDVPFTLYFHFSSLVNHWARSIMYCSMNVGSHLQESAFLFSSHLLWLLCQQIGIDTMDIGPCS